MRTISLRVLEFLLACLTAFIVSVFLITLITYVPLIRGSAGPELLRHFSVHISPPMTLPVAPWYAQGVKPPPLVDYALVTLDASADFTPVWDWNTHTVYVYCSVRYRTARFVENEVVVFDTILRSREEAVWAVQKKQKYPLEDAESGTLGGVPLEFVLRYQVVRFYGYSHTVEIVLNKSAEVLRVPATYTRVEDGEKG